MNMRRLNANFLLGALFLFAASCGSADKDENTPPPPTSGSGGGGASSGGANSGGTAGAGGVKASGGSSAGGSASGGSSMTSGGNGGGGGMMGGKNFGCPAEKPEEASACMRNFPTACTYDDGGCVCVEGAWDCYADADCPATAPEDAAACSLNGMACPYDNVSCTCSVMNGWTCESPCPMAPPGDAVECRREPERTCRYADGAIVQGGFGKADTTCACEDGKYDCFSQMDCPAAAPENESACTFATLSCPYDDRQCTCTDDAWSCVTECPEAPPSDGTACLRAAGSTCRYLEGALVQGFGGKSDATCACEDGSFTCFGEEDCPVSAPANGDACEFATLSCPYEGAQCNCGQEDTWACTTECPATVPAQDAACSRSEQAVCRYNDGELASGFGGSAEALCTCRDSKFDCLTQDDCPEAPPENQSACADLTNLSCGYDGQRCNCGQNGWTCQSECPAELPDAGAACMRPATSACLYVGGALVEAGTEPESTCVCSGNVFSCYSAADCPATAPENDVACDTPGLECAFGDQNCRCRTSTSAWSCMMSQQPPGGGGGAGGGGG